MKTVDLMSLP